MDPTLQEFFSTGGVSSTEHPQPSTATSHPAEGQRATGIQGKKTLKADVGQALSPGSARQLGEVTFSIHSSIPCSGKWMTMQGKSETREEFPLGTHTGKQEHVAVLFSLENPQLATTLQSKNTSDAPSLPAALPSTQLSNLPMPTQA